ncbi:MAG: hypothetical protein HKP61_20210 [Dactylosporangium sp.]|nr:hypothetical protein [Dactylosporangium sp.]NNJ63209.1 hypothetical protein [Dactylosporangium sp.]
MGYIEVTDQTYRELLSMAAAWHTTVCGALAKLVSDFTGELTGEQIAKTGTSVANISSRWSGGAISVNTSVEAVTVAVFARHAGTLTRGTFDPATNTITVTSGPLTGHRFASPSGAMRAVIRHANPSGRAQGNGWHFWIITATGEKLHTSRFGGQTPTSPEKPR